MDKLNFYSKLDEDGFLSGLYWDEEEPLHILHLNIIQTVGSVTHIKVDLLPTSKSLSKLVRDIEEMELAVSGLFHYKVRLSPELGTKVSLELDFLDQDVRTDKPVYLLAGTTETLDSLGKGE